jgi:hypothetical protein
MATWPGVAVGALSSAWLLARSRRGRGGSAGDAACWILVTSANVALFPYRAYVHEYWWFYLLPALAGSCAAGLEALRERFGALPAVAILAVVSGSGVAEHVDRERDVDRTAVAEATRAVREFYDERTLVLCLNERAFWYVHFAYPAWMWALPEGLPAVEPIVKRFRAGELRAIDRLVVLAWKPGEGSPRPIDEAGVSALRALGFVDGRPALQPSARLFELGR